VYAGKECARALAKDSLAAEDCNADLSDCSAEELQRLQQQLAHIQSTYDDVGKVRAVAIKPAQIGHSLQYAPARLAHFLQSKLKDLPCRDFVAALRSESVAGGSSTDSQCQHPAVCLHLAQTASLG